MMGNAPTVITMKRTRMMRIFLSKTCFSASPDEVSSRLSFAYTTPATTL